MKLKIFKPAIAAAILLLAFNSQGRAQVAPVQADSAAVPAETQMVTGISVDAEPIVSSKADRKALKVQMHQLKKQLKKISATTSAQVASAMKTVSVELNADLADIAPQIAQGFKDAANSATYSDDGKGDGDSEKVKNYSKSYSVDGDDQLSIDNKYGSVTVNTWAKSEFKVDVQIKVEANSDDDAKQMLDNITITDSKDGNNVSFKTNIGSEHSSWNWGRHAIHKMEINYTVYMPAHNPLAVDNNYGATILPDLDGKVTVRSGYGSLNAKRLTGPSDIEVKYGSAEISSLASSNLDVAYGSLNLGGADDLTARISYSSADIGKLHSAARIDVKYSGGLKIGDIDRNVKDLTINSSYSNVDLGLSGDENANFDITTHYGDFDYNDHNVTITSKSPRDDDRGPHFTYYYKGYLGKGSADKIITIHTSYGNVKFN